MKSLQIPRHTLEDYISSSSDSEDEERYTILKNARRTENELAEIAQALGYEAKREVGVSAQEVQAVQPEIIAPAPIDNQYLTVRYERLIPLLIEAIKELDIKIENLERK